MGSLDVRSGARWALAISIFALALAIGFFAMQIQQAVGTLHKIEPYLPQLLQASDDWRAEVEKGIALADRDLPRALSAAETTQVYLSKMTPEVLAELEAVRKTIDHQVPLVLTQIDSLEKQMPLVLAEVEQVRAAIPPILESIPPVLDAIGPILAESAALRNEIPTMLDSADELIGKAGEAGKKASEGAMTGMVSGVLRMPLDLLAGAGGLLLGGEALTKDEIHAFQKQATILLEAGKAGDIKPFAAKSGMTGEITLQEWYEENQQQCAKLVVFGQRRGKRGDQVRLSACPDGKGSWHYVTI